MNKNSIKYFFAIPITFSFYGIAVAAPAITNVSPDGGQLGQRQTFQVIGSGFGNRPSDGSVAPVLLDFGDSAFINGVADFRQQKFANNQEVVGLDLDGSTLWEKPSNPVYGAKRPVLRKSQDAARSGFGGAHYVMEGFNSYLGWPTAYGGGDTPTDHERLYVSWYMKMKFDPRFYWSASKESLKGMFSVGESVSVNDISGRFIGVSNIGITDGMLQFELEGQINSNNLKGQKITGTKSGATLIFPEKFAGGTGEGYESPGSNKFLRTWEDPSGKEGFRTAWTQAQVGHPFAYSPVTPDRWHFMEAFLDTDSGVLRAVVDRQVIASSDVSYSQAVSGKWSPTISLLGFNGKAQVFQITEIDDIYMDYRFGRVVLGNKENFDDLENYNLQIPVDWSDGRITFVLNAPADIASEKLYLYVINEKGEVNQQGYTLCSECKAPPSPVPLKVNN